jgi:hypothetical protein
MQEQQNEDKVPKIKKWADVTIYKNHEGVMRRMRIQLEATTQISFAPNCTAKLKATRFLETDISSDPQNMTSELKRFDDEVSGIISVHYAKCLALIAALTSFFKANNYESDFSTKWEC